MSSHYAKSVPSIVAEMQNKGEETNQSQHQPHIKRYVYRTDDGGIFISPKKLEEDDQPDAPIVEAEEKPLKKKSPFFVTVLIVFLIFMLLDSVDVTLTTLFTPTVTVTIIPKVKTITLSSTAALGMLLSPITLSESQTVATTGHGHQNAAQAVGTLTFYNGLSTIQSVPAGTILTSQDGVQVTPTQTVTIPAALPPQFGEATVTATATHPGEAGNIKAFDVVLALSSSLTVKNLSAFTGGRDHRDFQIVTQTDEDTAASDLRAKVTASMTAALQQQLTSTEQMKTEPCSPQVTTDHQVGDEAVTVTVTVALSCTAIAYDSQALTAQATRLLTTQASSKLGLGYRLYGRPTVTVTKATTTNKTVVLTFTSQGIWMYLINQFRIQHMVSGKTKVEALHVLQTLPGIQHATISGIADDQELPTDAGYIHLLLIYATF